MSLRDALNLPEDFVLKPFRPSGFYIPELDCLWYLARDNSYTAGPSEHPLVELLRYEGEVIGFKVHAFLKLSREVRDAILAKIDMDHDDIIGIERIWIQNATEMAPEMDAHEDAFLEWLKNQPKPR